MALGFNSWTESMFNMNPTVQRLIVFYSTLVDILCYRKEMQCGWSLNLQFLNQPLLRCLGFFSMGIGSFSLCRRSCSTSRMRYWSQTSNSRNGWGEKGLQEVSWFNPSHAGPYGARCPGPDPDVCVFPGPWIHLLWANWNLHHQIKLFGDAMGGPESPWGHHCGWCKDFSLHI